MASPASSAADHSKAVQGDALLKELRQGWKGLPNKTLFSLAIGGLRVRMMRSTVTMLSIVLAIAFLTYSGLSSTIDYSLVRVAQQLGDKASSEAGSPAQISAAVTALASMDLLGTLDAAGLKREAHLAGLTDTREQEQELPIAQRTLDRLQDTANDQENKYQTLLKAKDTVPADLNLARSQRLMANQDLAKGKKQSLTLTDQVTMSRWIRTGDLPKGVTDGQMQDRTRALIASKYHDLLINVSTPGRLSNKSLFMLDRPLALAKQGGATKDAQVVQQAMDSILASRESESLLNMLRRSGVNVQKTLAGNPMDVWLIVMALMTCAVGIANAMLMSVTERFREIGTMKCLGAQDNLVVKLFLLESAFLGVVGAAGGIVVGLLVSLLASVLQYGSFGISYFPVMGALPTIFWSVFGGILLSVVGAVYPAFAASRMKPVDALRVDE